MTTLLSGFDMRGVDRARASTRSDRSLPRTGAGARHDARRRDE